MISIKLDRPGGVLPSQFSLARVFNPVADGIANNVSQRFGNCIQQALVHVGVLTANYDFHLLRAAFSRVVDDARETPKQLLDRNHADLHYRAL